MKWRERERAVYISPRRRLIARRMIKTSKFAMDLIYAIIPPSRPLTTLTPRTISHLLKPAHFYTHASGPQDMRKDQVERVP